ncbi:GNAT family N-acetyltransferase [Sphingomonas rhizophila]|uniref:GNAT family N-acetyltransferase n=1 Tax=Sphingomonas rhizophila TaxID=2071607 RepID=A0A7G9SAQ8_9SPHN|nr:GNAT family N-acetyltransferase [Sphingomonas rhizophila]QNN64933.1 GNAT family N-acetyltransferase [Sphingomonas rhizophila]
MHLEPATTADIPALHGLIESAYRGDSARQGWTHEADLLGGQRTDAEGIEEMIVDPRQALLIFRDGDSIRACVALTDQGDNLAYLGLFTVEPGRQGTGLGRLLLAAAEDQAITRFGATRIEMTVIVQRRELIEWYRRRGYAVTGERRPFPHGNPRFGLPNRDDLEFLVMEKRLI